MPDERVRFEGRQQRGQGLAEPRQSRGYGVHRPACLEDRAAELARLGVLAGQHREQLDVRLVNVRDRPDEQLFVVYPGVVAMDAGSQCPAESATLVPQRGVLGQPEHARQQLVAAVVGYGGDKQILRPVRVAALVRTASSRLPSTSATMSTIAAG